MIRPLGLPPIVVAGLVAVHAGAPSRPCQLDVLHVDRYGTRRPILSGDVNVQYDAGGNVRLRCHNQNVYLDCDSLSALSGDYINLFGHVVYRDTVYRVTSDTMVYLLRTEQIEARGNVHVLDKATGSTLVGPYVDYWRAVKGVNDSARFVALKRPVVHYLARAAPRDTGSQLPYILTGDQLNGFGESRLYGGGTVSISRDLLHGTGDSLSFERGASTSIGELIGKPATLRRTGLDSFTVLGRRIRLGLAGDRLHDLHAFDSARVIRGASVIGGDTVQMGFTADKLSLTLAWGRGAPATLHSEGYDAVGDSLAVDTPGEQLHEVRVFRHGVIRNPVDTAVASLFAARHDSSAADSMRNTLWGDRVLARFAQIDSAGAIVTRLQHLEAIGDAASYYAQIVQQEGKPQPSVNYTLADTIVVAMRGGDSTGVAAVSARGHVNGIQLEAENVRKKSDSTAAHRPGTAPRKGKKP